MAFVDFMPDAELPVFVAAHSKHLSLGSQEQSVKDSTLNLFDFVAEVCENGGWYFFGPVDSKFSVLVGATGEYASLTIDEAAMHGPTGKITNPSLEVDPGGHRFGFELYDS